MRRYAVRLGRRAEADLEQLRDYLAAARTETFAKNFIAKILTHCRTLRTIPHRGTRFEDIRPGLRSVSWKQTVTIAFRVSDDLHRVDIVGIFYRGRDVRAALSERFKD